jgi:hypothetical protein
MALATFVFSGYKQYRLMRESTRSGRGDIAVKDVCTAWGQMLFL